MVQFTSAKLEPQLRQIAQQHGVDFDCVGPVPKEQFLRELKLVLERDDVPFPIEPEKRAIYLEKCQSGGHFSIGPFSGSHVQLGEFSTEQDYDAYSFEEHLSWACLVADQSKTKQKYACREYLQGEAMFDIIDSRIPNYFLLNARIYQQTGWQLASVKEIIPAELFFTCHANRFFPVTTFMRPLGVDYLEEPDIGHDVAGHVATFTIPAVANVMQYHGQARDLIYAERDQKIKTTSDIDEQNQITQFADELLKIAGRIYWFTVEFGLVLEDGNVRDFGAGILSSPGETKDSICSDRCNHILIDPSQESDLLRIANTDYLISEFQKTYFVMESFDKLNSLTPARIVEACKQAIQVPDFSWTDIIPGDRVIQVGTVATTINDKYYRLAAQQSQDECNQRTAVANLAMYRNGFDTSIWERFSVQPPVPPKT